MALDTSEVEKDKRLSGKISGIFQIIDIQHEEVA